MFLVTDRDGPIHVALVDDYDVVVVGVANMLEPYRDRVVVAELDTNKAVEDDVDIALYDSFAQPESDHDVVVVDEGDVDGAVAIGHEDETNPPRGVLDPS